MERPESWYSSPDIHPDLLPEDKSDESSLRSKSEDEDVERQATQSPTPEGKQDETARDPNQIDWDGPDDPENPRNWTFGQKWAAIAVVSSFTLISPIASSMVAPALPQISGDLGITSEVISQMTLSIFVLSYAIGPLFLGPLSEIYGRVPVLQLANLFFLVFNLVCGWAQNEAELLVFRLLAGFGGSAPLAIGGGVLADCFSAEERGMAAALYTLGPILGPALGPIAGGFIAESISWRWVFWIVSMADAVVQIFGIFFLRETWAPKILEGKARRRRQETGNNELQAVSSNVNMKLSSKLKISLSRPFKMLFTQPVVICLSLYMAFLYGVNYLLISTFSSLWTDVYGERVGIGGLNYIALAIGYLVGAQVTARFNDWAYKRMKAKNDGTGRPEFRVVVIIPGAILIPIGLFWYGWSAEAKVFWIMPDIGIAIYACAIMCANMGCQTYIIDTYTRYAASAIAAATFLRSLAGFGFPLFAPYMYDALGYGWGNSLLAFLSLAIGLPAPWFFWKYGPKLREMSHFAAGS